MNHPKLQEICDYEGFETPLDLLTEAIADSIVPGICMNRDCDYTTEVEPDCGDGYCEECKTQSVKSCLIIAGII